MTHQSNDDQKYDNCNAHVTTFNPAIVETMQKIVRDHRETLMYLSRFGTVTERAKASLIFTIAGEGV